MEVQEVTLKVINGGEVQFDLWSLPYSKDDQGYKNYDVRQTTGVAIVDYGGRDGVLFSLMKGKIAAIKGPKYVPATTPSMPRPSQYIWFSNGFAEYTVS